MNACSLYPTRYPMTPTDRADHAIKKLKARFNEGYAVDFQDLIARFTLDSATEFLFGQCVDSLSTTLPYPWNADPALQKREKSTAEDFVQAFALAQDAIAFRVRVGNIWPWYELFNDKTVEPMRVVDAYLVPILERALEKARKEKEVGLAGDSKLGEVDEDDTLLDHLVRFTQGQSAMYRACRWTLLTFLQTRLFSTMKSSTL